MPRFEYMCVECEEKFILVHKPGEVPRDQECIVCGHFDKPQRVYSFYLDKKIEGKDKPGTLVKAHIEEAKRELKREKNELAKKDFEI